MLTTGLAAVAAACVTTLAIPAAAVAAPGDPGRIVVSQADATGDVMILDTTDPGHGPRLVARRSIDLRGFTVVEQKTGVRMTVALRRILTNSRYDQVVEVQMKPVAGSGGVWFLDVAMSGQEPLDSVATYSPDLDGDNTTTCPNLFTTVDPEAATISTFVPQECLPTDPARIKVFSSLGHFPDGGVGYSLDRMKILGAHLLQG